MRYYLGIDGGGTKTAAVILDSTGGERGRGLGGPGNLATNDDAALTESLHQAVRSACRAAGIPAGTRFDSVCAGVAGYSAADRHAAYLAILRAEVKADSYRLEPDYV